MHHSSQRARQRARARHASTSGGSRMARHHSARLHPHQNKANRGRRPMTSTKSKPLYFFTTPSPLYNPHRLKYTTRLKRARGAPITQSEENYVAFSRGHTRKRPFNCRTSPWGPRVVYFPSCNATALMLTLRCFAFELYM